MSINKIEFLDAKVMASCRHNEPSSLQNNSNDAGGSQGCEVCLLAPAVPC